MKLRFFLDHCISNFISQTFRDAGYEVFRLRDDIPLDSADQDVISMVRLKDYLSANPDMNHHKGKLLVVEVHRIRVRE